MTFTSIEDRILMEDYHYRAFTQLNCNALCRQGLNFPVVEKISHVRSIFQSNANGDSPHVSIIFGSHIRSVRPGNPNSAQSVDDRIQSKYIFVLVQQP